MPAREDSLETKEQSTSEIVERTDDGDGRQEAAILAGPESAASAGDKPIVDDADSHVMSVVEHLDEMRARIIRSLLVFACALAACLYCGRDLVRLLELPAGNMQFQALSLEEPMVVYLKVSVYAALVIVCPWLVFELSAFVWPGLKARERRILRPIVFGGPLLFAAGSAFAYFLVLPPMLAFFNSFGLGMTPVHQRLDFYISLVLTFLLYMGLVFQLPIVLFALSFAGLVNSRQLLSVWRYAIFGSGVVAAVITPDPTVFSMLIVMAALVLLYFSTVWLLRMFGR